MTIAVVPITLTKPGQACSISVGDRELSFDWGRFDSPGSARFWIDQTERRGYIDRVRDEVEAVDLRDQTVFCLLGGHGITAEVATATFRELQRRVRLQATPDAEEIEAALRRPVRMPSGRDLRYRFWRQRAQRIAEALKFLDAGSPPSEARELRDWLMGISGVGPKTASWIVRNSTGSNDVAIVDIWLVRALTWAGVFPLDWTAHRDYFRLEAVFIAYANLGGVPPSALDWCIWEQGRALLPFLPPTNR